VPGLEQIEAARRNGATFSDEQVQQLLRYARAVERLQKTAQEELSFAPPPGMLADAASTPKTHIVGKDGIPFPNIEDIVMRPPPTPNALTPTPTPAPPWSPVPYEPPRKCEKNETTRAVFNDKEAEEKEHLKDLLFVPEGLVIEDYEETFGKGVEIEPYTIPYSRGTLVRMEVYGIPCVPYRIRMTNVADYTDSGVNALRSYDGDPAGRGKLSPIIQQRLAGKKEREPRPPAPPRRGRR
jgi:hypothetical protein